MAGGSNDSLYGVLGVTKKATQAEIQAAFKKRARELHPDVNKAPDAEEKFKKLVAAYEVLRDKERRARYDAHGSMGPTPSGRKKQQRRTSQRPEPPPFDFENLRFNFEDLGSPFDYMLRKQQRRSRREREMQLTIPLEQAMTGTTLTVTLDDPTAPSTFRLKIPKGAKEGDRLRIRDPEIVVMLHIEPHPRFEIDGRDISTTLDVAPWEAALGAEIQVPIPGASVKLKIPPGTSSGQRLRLRGQGLPLKPGKEGEPGDLYVKIRIVVPRATSDRARELWRQLADVVSFDPRAE